MRKACRYFFVLFLFYFHCSAVKSQACYNITENVDFLAFVKSLIVDHSSDINRLLRLPISINHGDNVFYEHKKFLVLNVDYGVRNVSINVFKVDYDLSSIQITKKNDVLQVQLEFFTEISFEGWVKSSLDSSTIPGKVTANGTLITFFAECLDPAFFQSFNPDTVASDLAKYLRATCTSSEISLRTFDMDYRVVDQHWLVRELIQEYIQMQQSAIERSVVEGIPPNIVDAINEFLQEENIRPYVSNFTLKIFEQF
eukprot:Sdes_comp19817_c0_seq1m11964